MTTDGDVETGEPASPTTETMEEQFEEFWHQLENAGNLRERIRAVAMEIESFTRLMHSSLLLVHQSGPVPEVFEKAKGQIVVLRELFGKLAKVLREWPGLYYRYHGDWRSETQSAISLLAFMHWLETGTLLLHTEVMEELGLNSLEFGLDFEDYLIGEWPEVFISFSQDTDAANCPSDELSMMGTRQTRKDWSLLPECLVLVLVQSLRALEDIEALLCDNLVPLEGNIEGIRRYVVNRVIGGDYDCPRKVLKFLTDMHASFLILNLRNDFLCKKFDGMKYDLRRVEEVYYDVKIRGLATNEAEEQSSSCTFPPS